jgi:hypothetical protein
VRNKDINENLKISTENLQGFNRINCVPRDDLSMS